MRKVLKGKKKYFHIYAFMAVLLMAGAAISLSVGSAGISVVNSIRLAISGMPGMTQLQRFLEGCEIPMLRQLGNFLDVSGLNKMHRYIILQVRLPRVLLSMLVGAGLSVAGGVFQGLFRNPLAEPHILGVSSGAAFGATVAILFGVDISFCGMGTIGICAFIGAIATIVLVCTIGGMKRGLGTTGVLLTGTAVSTLFSALMSLLMSLHHDKIEQVYLWTMGSFSSAVWIKSGYVAVFDLVCITACIVYASDLNLISMGEDTAQSLGVETVRVRRVLILMASMMVAICVSVSGVIGFVGLVIPHIMRFILGGDYRRILPASAIGGGFFMMICDTLARTLTSPGELPVGVITAITGAPYLIFLIMRKE